MPGVSKTAVLVVAIGVVIAAVVGAVLLVSGGADGRDSSSGTVKIELRARPPAKIRMNGRLVGTTPTTIIVPRSKQPIDLEATFAIEKIGMMKPTKKVETWRQIKTIVPDAEQSVDFNQADAVKVDESLGPR